MFLEKVSYIHRINPKVAIVMIMVIKVNKNVNQVHFLDLLTSSKHGSETTALPNWHTAGACYICTCKSHVKLYTSVISVCVVLMIV